MTSVAVISNRAFSGGIRARLGNRGYIRDFGKTLGVARSTFSLLLDPIQPASNLAGYLAGRLGKFVCIFVTLACAPAKIGKKFGHNEVLDAVNEETEQYHPWLETIQQAIML